MTTTRVVQTTWHAAVTIHMYIKEGVDEFLEITEEFCREYEASSISLDDEVTSVGGLSTPPASGNELRRLVSSFARAAMTDLETGAFKIEIGHTCLLDEDDDNAECMAFRSYCQYLFICSLSDSYMHMEMTLRPNGRMTSRGAIVHWVDDEIVVAPCSPKDIRSSYVSSAEGLAKQVD